MKEISHQTSAPRSLRPPPASLAVVAAAEEVFGDPGEITEPILEAADIQGNIWPGFNTAHLAMLGLRILPEARDQARLWLRELTPLVSSMQDVWQAREVRRAVAKATGTAPPRPDVFLNVAFSFPALSLLGLPDSALPPDVYRAGMAAADLQDPADVNGVPLGWVTGATPDTTPHVFLLIGADGGQELADAVAIVRSRTGAGSGLQLIYEDQGHRLPEDREHFGFRDGVSQPGLRGRLNEHPESFVTRRSLDPADPLAERFARPGQQLLWPGEFLFGYPSQDEFSEGPGRPAQPPAAWMKNGSFLVFRRLRQDVAKFQEFAAREAAQVSAQLGKEISPAEIQAWTVGRWPDGSSLVRCPVAPCATTEDAAAMNHFDYAAAMPATTEHGPGGPIAVTAAPDDVDGSRCPHFAHVRKVNLRDKPTDIRASQLFRMLRRGIPYGPPWQAGESNPPDRGLLFLSYQRRLDQFLTPSALWMNQATSPEGPHGHDLLVGQRRTGRQATRTLEGTAVTLTSPAGEQWVTPTGGGFFFAPARSVLASLTSSLPPLA